MELNTYIVENKHFSMLNILSLGRHRCRSGYTFSYAYTNFYLIHYVVKGKGVFYKNGLPHKVKGGEIFIIKPENPPFPGYIPFRLYIRFSPVPKILFS